MGRVYRYRKHIRWGLYLIPVLYGLLTAVCALPATQVLLARGASASAGLVAISAAFSIFVLGLGICLALLFRHMAGVSVSVDEGGIMYGSRRGRVAIPFESIARLTFPSIRYTGGWTKIVSEGRTIRLTVVLDGIGEFLQELKVALDERGLQDRYDRKKFFRFLKTATFSDQGWERIYATFWGLVLLTVLAALAGYAVPKLAGVGILGRLLWFVSSALWPSMVYVLTEVVSGMRIAEKADEEAFSFPPRDIAYERAVYHKALRWGGLTYLAASAAALVALRFLM